MGVCDSSRNGSVLPRSLSFPRRQLCYRRASVTLSHHNQLRNKQTVREKPSFFLSCSLRLVLWYVTMPGPTATAMEVQRHCQDSWYSRRLDLSHCLQKNYSERTLSYTLAHFPLFPQACTVSWRATDAGAWKDLQSLHLTPVSTGHELQDMD